MSGAKVALARRGRMMQMYYAKAKEIPCGRKATILAVHGGGILVGRRSANGRPVQA